MRAQTAAAVRGWLPRTGNQVEPIAILIDTVICDFCGTGIDRCILIIAILI